METGVAILGHYDDEAFDRHSLAHEHKSLGGLSESVSFGRFAVDSHSWVKRSSFNHNQYLEELGNCSTQGSVRQKKAYFEAYYKAIAKRKALEDAAAAEGTDNSHALEDNAKDGSIKDPMFISKSNLDNAYTSGSIPCCTQVLNDDVTTSNNDDKQSDNHKILPATGDPELSDSANQDVDGRVEKCAVNSDGLSGCLLPSPIDLYLDAAKHCKNIVETVVEASDGFISKIQHDKLEKSSADRTSPDTFPITSLTDGMLITGGKNVLNSISDVLDVQMIEISGQEAHNSHPVQISSSHIAVNHKKAARPQKQGHLQPKSNKANVERSTNVLPRASRPSLKLNRGLNKKGQEHGGLIETKRSANTVGHARTNVTVPQPFVLDTNKTAAALASSQEQHGEVSCTQKPVQKGNWGAFSLLKRTQAPLTIEKKSLRLMPITDENAKSKKRPEGPPKFPSELKRDVTPKEYRNQEGDITNNKQTTVPRQTGSNRKQRPSVAKINTFSFKCDDRAEKRKEFNSKIEAKITAKEAEKNQAEAKTQEVAEEELKKLRKSLRFRATPMPNFYQESGQPKIENKKDVILTTRAKSPKLGQKANSRVKNPESRSLSNGPVDTFAPTQAPKVRASSVNREASVLAQRSRNSFPLSSKTSKVADLAEERPGHQVSGLQKISNVRQSGSGCNSCDNSGASLIARKNMEKKVKQGPGSDSIPSRNIISIQGRNESLLEDRSSDLECSSDSIFALPGIDQREERRSVCLDHPIEEVVTSKEKPKQDAEADRIS